MTSITILSQSIRQNDGLYSLNDLHKAAGAERRHRPVHFLQNQQTTELIGEISKVGIPTLVKKHGGRDPGTYACRELVIAYAAWINPKFHLAVLKSFLDAQAPAALPPQTLSPASQLKLRKAVADKAQGSRLKFSAIYQSLYTHFQVAKYDQIRESNLSAALAFIQGLEIKVPELAGPSADLNLGVKVDYSAPTSHESITSGLYRLSQALTYKGQGDAAYICEGAMELLSHYYSQIEQIRLLIAGNAARNRSAA